MSTNKTKNKRGGRGSNDEDLVCPKKKLADDIEDAIEVLEEQQQEPRLMEIKTILIDIRIQVFSIGKDNLELKNIIEQLKNLVRSQGNDLDELRKSVNFNDNDINQLKQATQKIEEEKMLSANNSLKATREKLQQQVEESRHLEEELDNLEQIISLKELVGNTWSATRRLHFHRTRSYKSG